ncbi:hypothetical protein R8Z50_12255 [Longispora sp. K20-0274]|uniref:hypothetical protein n=1 Tax=Longispora sp. K20-0274 TaxID=3088255 RepID=UPI00399A7355
MSTVSPEDLATKIRNAERAALVIGFDGTAALLGHRDHLDLGSWLQGNRSESRLAVNLSDRFAGHRTDPSRVALVKELTTTTAGGAYDERAIDVIAELLKSRTIATVVATDPWLRLYQALRSRIGDLELLDASNIDPTKLEAYAKSGVGSAVYIQAGAILLSGYREGVRNDATNERGYVNRNSLSLRRILDQFTNVYCWGWCEANAPYNFFSGDDDSSQVIYALGDYTRIGELQRTTEVCVDDGELRDTGGVATTHLLLKLGEALDFRTVGTGSSGAPSPSGARTGSPAGPVARQTLPILSRRALEGLLSENDDGLRDITIIGVEDCTVRQSVATWYHTELSALADTYLYLDSSFLTLGQTLFIQTERNRQQHLVGCYLDGGEPDQVWQETLTTFLHLWGSPPARVRHRVTLFCPVEVSLWLRDQLTGDQSGIWIETYPSTTYLTRPNIQEWLLSVLKPWGEPAPSLVQELSGRIVDAATNGFRAEGTFSPALELWQQQMLDSFNATTDDGERPDPIDVWECLVAAIRSASAMVRTSADISIQDDFVLGPITPRGYAVTMEGTELPGPDAQDVTGGDGGSGGDGPFGGDGPPAAEGGEGS